MSRLIQIAAVIGLAALAVGSALAQEFPTKRVIMITTSLAGGVPDLLARVLAPKLSLLWGQPVIVDSRGGAGGNVAAAIAAKAAPDGHTVFLVNSSPLTTSHLLYSKLPFDPTKDFAPVTTLVQFPSIIVANSSTGVKSLKELQMFAKANPSSLNYGSIGTGSVMHLGMELFNHVAGVNIVHIPYKGTPEVLRSLMAGDTQIGFLGGGGDEFMGMAKSGKVRILAIAGDKHSARFPGVPTFAEAGFPDMKGPNWLGIVVPARTPPPIIDKLNRDFVRLVHDPDIVGKFIEPRGYDPVGDTPDQFSARIRETMALWAPIIINAKISID